MDRVTYKPLGTRNNNNDLNEDDDQEEDTDDNEDEEEDNDESAQCRITHSRKNDHDQKQFQYYSVFNERTTSRWMATQFGLKHLRLLLYLVAILLFLVFILQFSTTSTKIVTDVSANNSQGRWQQKARETSTKLNNNNSPVISSTTKLLPISAKLNSDNNRVDIEPQQLDGPQHGTSNNMINFDDLQPPNDDRYDQDNNRSTLNVIGKWWTLDLRNDNKYITATNYIRAIKSFGRDSSITLSTQATTEFMYHTLELCKRWDGPISVAVFCPGAELQVAITLIKFMRHCLPSPLSGCIRDKVTWHLVYNRVHGPVPSALSYPRKHLDAEHFPLFVNQDQCPKFPGPEPDDLLRQFEAKLMHVNQLSPSNYRQQFQLPYPINVLRNTARMAATTKYVLASDIELYPSINLVPSFINYIKNNNLRERYNYMKRFVFTLPIFEVKSNVSAPKTKEELVKMLAKGDAIFFHKWVCDVCQNFPNRLDWTQTNSKLEEGGHHHHEDEISIFEITQRDKSRDQWEPIFIGTNEDPPYDDRLTWEGRRDKMGQMFEMCLLDYYLLVLGDAFLVHAPGIKHIADHSDTMKRIKYIKENNSIYDATMAKLKQQHASSPNINKC